MYAPAAPQRWALAQGMALHALCRERNRGHMGRWGVARRVQQRGTQRSTPYPSPGVSGGAPRPGTRARGCAGAAARKQFAAARQGIMCGPTPASLQGPPFAPPALQTGGCQTCMGERSQRCASGGPLVGLVHGGVHPQARSLRQQLAGRRLHPRVRAWRTRTAAWVHPGSPLPSVGSSTGPETGMQLVPAGGAGVTAGTPAVAGHLLGVCLSACCACNTAAETHRGCPAIPEKSMGPVHCPCAAAPAQAAKSV